MSTLFNIYYKGAKVSAYEMTKEDCWQMSREYEEKYGSVIETRCFRSGYEEYLSCEELLRRMNLPVKKILDFQKEPDFKEREDYIVIVGSKIIVKRLSDGELRGCMYQYEDYNGEERLESYFAEHYQMYVDKVVFTGTPPEIELRSCKDEIINTLEFSENDRDMSVDGIESLRNELYDDGPEVYTNEGFAVPDWLVIYGKDNIIKLKFTAKMKELFVGKFRIYGPEDSEGRWQFACEYAKLLGVELKSNLYEFLYGEDVEEIRVGW